MGQELGNGNKDGQHRSTDTRPKMNDGQHRTDGTGALNNGQRAISPAGVVGQESGGEQQMRVPKSDNKAMSPNQCKESLEGKDYDKDDGY